MNTHPKAATCPKCSAAVPSDAPGELCPRCVLLGAATPSESGLARQSEPPSLERVRASFPHLEIQELIGHGGMGFVYSARQPALDRAVALKLLPVAAGSDPRFAERFAREGRLLARLNHPNIVTVYDFGQSEGFCYLIMELVDGVNLRQAMRAGRFSPREALTLVPKICEALQYAHEQGVLHRDIKPENILLDSRGRVKIADFGIAKLIGDRPGDVTLTGSGARLGTPHYMAPEQVESPSEVDHRADIYSLGVVFYELLTGELPLGRFAPPSAKADLDARVDEIVLRALAKERELRQQSAGEVKTQVEGLASADPQASAKLPSTPWWGREDFEYTSPRRLFGLPLVQIVSGRDRQSGRPREARGILAVGPSASGWFAFGGRARGIVAFGGLAMGGFAFGGVAVGGIAVGGLSLGLLSFGGLAIALLLASGGIAIGWEAFGGMAMGHRAWGGMTIATIASGSPDGWRRWLLGWMPWAWIPMMLLSGIPFAVSLWVSRLQNRPTTPRPNPWAHRLFWLIVGTIALVGSAVIAGLVAPRMDHPSFAVMVPLLVGIAVWLGFWRTRPTAAEAMPAERWNPWPKRIFLLIVLVVLLPISLVVIGLVVPLLAWRASRAPTPPRPVLATYSLVEQRQGEQSAELTWALAAPEALAISLQFRDHRQTASLPALGTLGDGWSGWIALKLFPEQDGHATRVQFSTMSKPTNSTPAEVRIDLPFTNAVSDLSFHEKTSGELIRGVTSALTLIGNDALTLRVAEASESNQSP